MKHSLGTTKVHAETFPWNNKSSCETFPGHGRAFSFCVGRTFLFYVGAGHFYFMLGAGHVFYVGGRAFFYVGARHFHFMLGAGHFF